MIEVFLWSFVVLVPVVGCGVALWVWAVRRQRVVHRVRRTDLEAFETQASQEEDR